MIQAPGACTTKPGSSYWSGRHSMVDLLVFTSLG